MGCKRERERERERERVDNTQGVYDQGVYQGWIQDFQISGVAGLRA